jgi:Zn-dependent protease with chaperone function
MKGVTRSFWALVVIAAVAEGLLVYLAIDSLNHLRTCFFGQPPPATLRPGLASCGHAVVLVRYHNWVPAVVILAFVASTLLVGVATLLSQIIRTRRAVKNLGYPIDSPPSLAAAAASLDINVTLVEDYRCFCCTAGFLFPRVIISTEMIGRLEPDQLRAVLAHERTHVQRRDPARATAVRVAARAMYYLPLAGHLAEKSLVASELGADSSAAAVAGQDALVEALLRVLEEVRPALGSATEMASLDALDSRIEALQTRRLPRIRPSVLIVSASLIAAGLLCVITLWLPSTPTHIVQSPPGHVVHPRLIPGTITPRAPSSPAG